MGQNYRDNFILASQSPRRREILAAHGHHFDCCPADIEENLPDGIQPDEAVQFLALKKALAIETEHPEFHGRLIIASDTVVWKDRIMGKPENLQDARAMIQSIRATTHRVVTGVALVVCGEPVRRVFSETTYVHCKDYSDAFIESYIQTEEPYDKAGGYAIQLTFHDYIESIEGDYNNVVGLPYDRMMEEIEKL